VITVVEALHELWTLVEMLRELPALIKANPVMSVVVLILALSGVAIAVAMRRSTHQTPPSIR
jgi:hypothetical protein